MVMHEWRDAGSPYLIGPSLTIAGGVVRSGSKQLMDLPTGTWAKFELAAKLGEAQDGTWSLTITPAGGQPTTFPDLPVMRAGWRTIEWLGFSSNADAETVYYLDELKIENGK